MGQMLDALLKLQSVETQLATVRSRLRARENTVKAEQRKIDALREQHDGLHQELLTRRASADELDLDLKQKEEEITKLRTSLNSARTNKEYSAVLTQINTFRADNAKVEELALQKMQEAEEVKALSEQLEAQIAEENRTLEEMVNNNAGEIERLSGMMTELQGQRDDASAGVAPGVLGTFDRMVERYEGEAMAVIDASGKKPPYTYTCGGCFMSLNPEHVNALQVVDEIRTCDNCGRILHLDPAEEKTKA
jgi:uncharacterized protein